MFLDEEADSFSDPWTLDNSDDEIPFGIFDICADFSQYL